MPPLSRLYIKTALIHLTIGFTFGALMLANKGVPINPVWWRLLPAHMEILLLGWTVQLALGVAFWILPRLPQGGRGDTRGAWVAYACLNSGVWLVILSNWLTLPPFWLFFGRVLEAVAIVAFVRHIWPRIIPYVGGQ
ncbi:MAG: hypothetical protein KA314_25860 [Chloroflexi bacterium]|jgi:hypothetical protein|nr:hypothetical protein [Chloroflexota bacterium]MBP8059275.1 hypothetical protein [Chloroflexota bacterium]